MRDIQNLADLAQVRVLAPERERRRSARDLEAGHLGKHIQDLFREAFGKEGLIAAGRKVVESEHRDRLVVGRCQRDLGAVNLGHRRHVRGDREQYPLEDHETHDRDEHADRDEVELAASLGRDRMAAVDLGFALEAFGGQLVRPGKHEHGNKQYDARKQEDREDPARCADVADDDVDDLQHKPAGYNVGDRDAEHVAAL